MKVCQVLDEYPSFLPGGMGVCCFPVMEPTDQSPEDFFHSPDVEALRQQFRDDNPPVLCRDCLAVNEITGFRQYTSGSDELDFSTLSIANSSKCNKACRMCKPNLSTTLSGVEGGSKKPIVNKYLRDIVTRYSDTIRNVFVSGGNPMQDDDLWDILSTLDTSTVDRVTVTTNGSGIPESVYPLLGRFKGSCICISIDGDKRYNELMRTFTEQKRVYETINAALEKTKVYPNLSVAVQFTKTNVSVQRYRELYEELEANVPDLHTLQFSNNVCFFPEIYAPWNLGEEKRVEVRDKLSDDVVYLFKKRTHIAELMVEDILLAERLISMKPVNFELLEDFKRETARFDKISGKDMISIQNIY